MILEIRFLRVSFSFESASYFIRQRAESVAISSFLFAKVDESSPRRSFIEDICFSYSAACREFIGEAFC